MQEIHASLKEDDVAVLALEEPTLCDVICQDIIQGREPRDRSRVLHCHIFGWATTQHLGDRRQLGSGSPSQASGEAAQAIIGRKGGEWSSGRSTGEGAARGGQKQFMTHA